MITQAMFDNRTATTLVLKAQSAINSEMDNLEVKHFGHLIGKTVGWLWWKTTICDLQQAKASAAFSVRAEHSNELNRLLEQSNLCVNLLRTFGRGCKAMLFSPAHMMILLKYTEEEDTHGN